MQNMPRFAYGAAYFALGKYSDALLFIERAIKRNPNFVPNYIFKAVTLAFLDRIG